MPYLPWHCLLASCPLLIHPPWEPIEPMPPARLLRLCCGTGLPGPLGPPLGACPLAQEGGSSLSPGFLGTLGIPDCGIQGLVQPPRGPGFGQGSHRFDAFRARQRERACGQRAWRGIRSASLSLSASLWTEHVKLMVSAHWGPQGTEGNGAHPGLEVWARRWLEGRDELKVPQPWGPLQVPADCRAQLHPGWITPPTKPFHSGWVAPPQAVPVP